MQQKIFILQQQQISSYKERRIYFYSHLHGVLDVSLQNVLFHLWNKTSENLAMARGRISDIFKSTLMVLQARHVFGFLTTF